METKKLNRTGSLFWMVLGIYVAIHAYQLGIGRLRQPGPGFLFFLTALLLILLCAIEVARTFIGKSEKGREKVVVFSGIRWEKIILVLVGVSIYAYLFNWLGFLLSTFLLMIFLFKAVEPTKWWVAITGSLITTALSYGIFERWLDVPFPRGLLGF
jgi:putative tricarboxylic transport membrane protein